MKENWIVESLRLQLAGDFYAAAKILREHCGSHPSARIRLALIGDRIGLSKSDCVALIQQVESGGSYEDYETNFQLFKAYDAYFGKGEDEEMPRKALFYLERAALAVDAPIGVIESVVNRYKFGSSAGAANSSLAQKWQKILDERKARNKILDE